MLIDLQQNRRAFAILTTQNLNQIKQLLIGSQRLLIFLFLLAYTVNTKTIPTTTNLSSQPHDKKTVNFTPLSDYEITVNWDFSKSYGRRFLRQWFQWSWTTEVSFWSQQLMSAEIKHTQEVRYIVDVYRREDRLSLVYLPINSECPPTKLYNS